MSIELRWSRERAQLRRIVSVSLAYIAAAKGSTYPKVHFMFKFAVTAIQIYQLPILDQFSTNVCTRFACALRTSFVSNNVYVWYNVKFEWITEQNTINFTQFDFNNIRIHTFILWLWRRRRWKRRQIETFAHKYSSIYKHNEIATIHPGWKYYVYGYNIGLSHQHSFEMIILAWFGLAWLGSICMKNKMPKRIGAKKKRKEILYKIHLARWWWQRHLNRVQWMRKTNQKYMNR